MELNLRDRTGEAFSNIFKILHDLSDLASGMICMIWPLLLRPLGLAGIFPHPPVARDRCRIALPFTTVSMTQYKEVTTRAELVPRLWLLLNKSLYECMHVYIYIYTIYI